MAKNKQDSSWKNLEKWSKGKERLKNGVMQHPDEDPGTKSVYNYMKGSINKRKELHILPFGQFEKLGKMNEDMLSPMDSAGASSNTPGQFHQTPDSMPGDNMDKFALAGPQRKTKKKKKSIKKNKDTNHSFDHSKVLTFDDFMNREI